MTNLILAAVAALVVGIIIGVLFGRSGQGASLRQRRAEQKIDELRGEFTRYQAQVNEHFLESAQLMERFNDAYRDVNQHMARGANRLCNDEEWPESLAQDVSGRIEHSDSDSSEPPRDYAPKADPEEKGTLAEDFGLPKDEKRPA
ncbi:YhcB family protein [Marinobacter sp.]|uniref:YhcB family protein n=1 Tax=Marinobacter sp. TaxID=50741 RepID=UPI002B2679B7|nr:YhcB family protein [Marinobacter sp.]